MADSDKCRPIIGHDVAPHCRKYTRHPAGKYLELLVLKSWKVKLLSNSSNSARRVARYGADRAGRRLSRQDASVRLLQTTVGHSTSSHRVQPPPAASEPGCLYRRCRPEAGFAARHLVRRKSAMIPLAPTCKSGHPGRGSSD